MLMEKFYVLKNKKITVLCNQMALPLQFMYFPIVILPQFLNVSMFAVIFF